MILLFHSISDQHLCNVQYGSGFRYLILLYIWIICETDK